MMNILYLPSSGEIWPNTLLRTCYLVMWRVWLALTGVWRFGSEIASVKIRIFDEKSRLIVSSEAKFTTMAALVGSDKFTAVSAVSLLPGVRRRGGGYASVMEIDSTT
mmetsp:Transcript_38877/g.79502  ORF Transcript_38877/g.79502 Transcript_38877/m.79502 type:complete len:107 (+) Transcript_38877:82-402(+)